MTDHLKFPGSETSADPPASPISIYHPTEYAVPDKNNYLELARHITEWSHFSGPAIPNFPRFVAHGSIPVEVMVQIGKGQMQKRVQQLPVHTPLVADNLEQAFQMYPMVIAMAGAAQLEQMKKQQSRNRLLGLQ
jgi:hypothetical protein